MRDVPILVNATCAWAKEDAVSTAEKISAAQGHSREQGVPLALTKLCLLGSHYSVSERRWIVVWS